MADVVDKGQKKAGISVLRPVLAVLCIIFGILLLVFPQLVGLYIIGIFLIIQGILLVVDCMDTKHQQVPPTLFTEPPEPPPAPSPTENP